MPWDEIAKGYELEDGRWVLLSDADLEAAAPRKSHTIDIESFVEEQEIDPIYLDRPYLLVPENESAARAYALLGEAMRRSGKVALGRFVMRAKEHLVSIRPRAELLTLTTMRFHDEVRSSAEIAAELDTAAEPTGEQIENAMAIIEELEVPFDPTRYRDEHSAHLEAHHQAQAEGPEDLRPLGQAREAHDPDGARSHGRTAAEPRTDQGRGRRKEEAQEDTRKGGRDPAKRLRYTTRLS